MNQARDTAGVIVPPPVILAVAFALGLGAGWLWPLPMGSSGWRWPVAVVFALAGVTLLAAALWRFRAAETPPEPWRPTTALVVHGPYRFTRNPIYLAGALVYAAVALALNEGWLLLALAPALAVLHFGVIVREERYLERKFGEDYLRYKASVRRWL